MDNKESEILKLKEENQYLKRILEENNIDYLCYDKFINNNVPKNITVKIKEENLDKDHVRLFYSIFKGRKDVYAKRASKHNAKGQTPYYTQCHNFWKYGICFKTEGIKKPCSECKNKRYKELTGNDIFNHLLGIKEDCSDVIGIYPLLTDDTCNFLVFDFDNHNDSKENEKYKQEVSSIRQICKILKISEYTERSRSGNGYHIWIFFKDNIQASLARKFGELLIDKGLDYVNIKSFDYLDKMIPAQDNIPKDKNGNVGLGNLIALPLQGRAIKNNNSVFVDDNFVAYDDQWDVLRNINRLSKKFVEDFVNENEIKDNEEIKPWDKRKTIYKEDFFDIVEITLSDKVYIDCRKIAKRSQNAIRRMCSFSNPEFYKNRAIGLSNYGVPRVVYAGYDENNYICVPRGLKDELLSVFKDKDIKYLLNDLRVKDNKIDVNFIGNLYPEQQDAVNEILKYDTGIICATTAFGKTVVGANIISSLKLNTLILVNNKVIQNNWLEDLSKFLKINEDKREYITKGGSVRKRKSLIGRLYGGHNSLTGIIDIVMLPSLARKQDIEDLNDKYSLILIDECHHSAADSIYRVLNNFKAKYIYGLTATPKRDDGMEKLVYMSIGPIRYTYTALDRNRKQGINHYVYPKFTCLNSLRDLNINEAYKLVVNSKQRNVQIVNDVIDCINNNRTPLVLTKYKDHANILYELLKDKANKVYLLEGGGNTSKKMAILSELKSVCKEDSLVVIAIDKYVGEGFNLPRLDTLMLTMPIKWEGNIEQYAGRLQRDYDGKKDVIIYDYIDSNIRMLDRMYFSRLKTYKKIGYEICNKFNINDDSNNKFFDNDDYLDVYINDLKTANNEVIISSVSLSRNKIYKFINLIKEKEYSGVKFTVITLDSLVYSDNNKKNINNLISILRDIGVNVILRTNMYKHYSIIDNKIVWYGNANILSISKDEDNMMRIVDEDVVIQLIDHEKEDIGVFATNLTNGKSIKILNGF